MEEHGARDGEGAATSPSHKWSPAPAPGAWWRPGERSERRGHRQLSRRHNAALFLSCAAKGVGTVSGVRYTCVTPGPGPGPVLVPILYKVVYSNEERHVGIPRNRKYDQFSSRHSLGQVVSQSQTVMRRVRPVSLYGTVLDNYSLTVARKQRKDEVSDRLLHSLFTVIHCRAHGTVAKKTILKLCS